MTEDDPHTATSHRANGSHCVKGCERYPEAKDVQGPADPPTFEEPAQLLHTIAPQHIDLCEVEQIENDKVLM